MNKMIRGTRRRWAIPAAVVVTLCLALAGPAAAAEPSRPFMGHTTADVDSSGPPIGCPAGAFIRYTAEAQGIFLHLGQVDMTVTHCVWLDLATGAGTFGDGTITMTAANGDVLVLAQHGTLQLTPWPNATTSTVQMLWVVVDGTGRFAASTGSGLATVVSNLAENTSTAEFSGTIAY